MLKLSDWNKVVDHATLIVNKASKSTGYDLRIKEYSMYDGRKGIYLQIFDKNGQCYTQFATGTYNTVIEYVEAINHYVILLVDQVL